MACFFKGNYHFLFIKEHWIKEFNGLKKILMDYELIEFKADL